MKNLILAVLFLLPSQTFSNKNKISVKGIVLVHYNAEFNSSNNFSDISRVKDCKIYEAWIDQDPKLKESEGIRSVPTVILYNNGKEIKRWEAGLSLNLDIHYSELQKEVDKITGANKW